MKTRSPSCSASSIPIIQGGMHYRRLRRDGGGRLERRRARHHHRADAAARRRRSANEIAPLPRDDRQAVRREPHLPARRSRRPTIPATSAPSSTAASRSSRPPATTRRSGCPSLQGGRHQGDPQMHLGAPLAEGRVDRLRRGQRRRLRVRRPSRRGRRAQLHPAAARGRGAEDPVRRLRRHGRRPLAGRGAGARRRRHEHGHALHGDARRRRSTRT